MSSSAVDVSREHVVIIGGGFGGLQAARRLRKTPVRVTLIDRHNYHLFQPLLYQVATGGLSPANIASPLRTILRRQKNCETLLAEVVDFDLPNRKVILADGEVSFDWLIVAAGATHSYFGNEHWEPFAPGLKSLSEATEIRRRIYLAFEAAERETDPNERAKWLTFVVVGGGPTGVELAGAISEIARQTLRHDFRQINPQDARVLLVEHAPHVLNHYPESLSVKAEERIRRLGIEIVCGSKVVNIDQEGVDLQSMEDGPTRISTRTVLWAAGVQANPLGRVLAKAAGIEPGHGGRVPVEAGLNLAGHPRVFAIGDISTCLDESGRPLPGMAPVAMQQGEYLAKLIAGQKAPAQGGEPFRYQDHGSMATVGRAVAVAQIGKRQFCGLFAWLLWLFVHLMQITLLQNRLLVFVQWGWNYLTFNRSARIITGEESLKLPSRNQVEPDRQS